jgi:MFS family permease
LSRLILVLCIASWGWGFNFGAGAPLASLALKEAGFSDGVIGLNTASYYLGIALAAVIVPWSMRRFGRLSLVAGMVAAAAAVALFPWTENLACWFGLRGLNGVASALCIIPMETIINRDSAPEHRSRNFGYYAFSMALGIAAGELAGMQIYAFSPRLAFALGSSGAWAAALAVQIWLPWPGKVAGPRKGSAPLDFVKNFLSFGSAWSQGFLEGGMIGLMPVYLLGRGLGANGISWMLSGIMIGVISFQLPVAWLADRFGRRAVLLGCYTATVMALALVLYDVGLIGLTACLFLAGACSTAFYPLGLALLGERLPGSTHDRANAWYLGINCLGSVTGPAWAGAAMDRFGNQALIASGLGAVLLVLVMLIGLRFLGPRALPSSAAVEGRRAA